MFSGTDNFGTYLNSYIYLFLWHTVPSVKLTMYFPTHILPVADIKYSKCSSDFYKVSLVGSSMQ